MPEDYTKELQKIHIATVNDLPHLLKHYQISNFIDAVFPNNETKKSYSALSFSSGVINLKAITIVEIYQKQKYFFQIIFYISKLYYLLNILH